MSNNSALSAAKKRRGGLPTPGQPPSCQVSTPSSGSSQPVSKGVAGPRIMIPPHVANNPQLLAQFQQAYIQRQMLMQQQQQGSQNGQQDMTNVLQGAQRPIIPPGQPMPAALNNAKNNMVSPGFSQNNMVNQSRPVSAPSMNGNVVLNQPQLKFSELVLSSNGAQCTSNGIPLPPGILMNVYYNELMDHNAELNDFSNRIMNLNSRLEKIERNSGVNSQTLNNTGVSGDVSDLATNNEFIASVVDNIVNNTNLSDLINQIDPIQKEHAELRNMLVTQQSVINELSSLVMKLLNDKQSLHINGCCVDSMNDGNDLNCCNNMNCSNCEIIPVEQNNVDDNVEHENNEEDENNTLESNEQNVELTIDESEI